MNFKSCHVIGKNIDETWFKLLYELGQKGRQFKVTKGSFAGDTRLEFDFISGTILKPIQYSETGERLSLAVTTPVGCPSPVTDDMIYEYFNNYLLNSKLEPTEHYKYATWIVGGEYKIPQIDLEDGEGLFKNFLINVPNQLEFCVNHFCEKVDNGFNFGNNHCRILISYPESLFVYNLPYTNEQDRGTMPCLQIIDMKMLKENNQWFLIFYILMRSWDCFSGWPLNVAGLILLQEYISIKIYEKTGIHIEVGPFSFISKGLHVYGNALDALKMKVGTLSFQEE
jgi:thymidylate synthase